VEQFVVTSLGNNGGLRQVAVAVLQRMAKIKEVGTLLGK